VLIPYTCPSGTVSYKAASEYTTGRPEQDAARAEATLARYLQGKRRGGIPDPTAF